LNAQTFWLFDDEDADEVVRLTDNVKEEIEALFEVAARASEVCYLSQSRRFANGKLQELAVRNDGAHFAKKPRQDQFTILVRRAKWRFC